MLEHIVKNGESIGHILELYHLELQELKAVNLHITDLDNIMSGMKIKIPLINKEIEQILTNTESFVQQYYPKITDLFEDDVKVDSPKEKQAIEKEVIKEEAKEETKEEITRSQDIEKTRHIPRRAYPGIIPPRNPYKR